ncbi:MAG: NADH-quinone oxidoreductase subunit L, partial [Chloroflexi bacterium]|nr:NADH-quinone oxidoreductase subunit L [Chloroflexota bacterium]
LGAHDLAKHPRQFPLFQIPTGDSFLKLGFMVDPLTAVMLFMVPFVCLMIFIYSVGYMAGDPRYSRFFAYISLFACGMLGLVVADNLFMLLVFWEIMGLCSYLLIGFWFEKPSAMRAGLKAFLTTRIGDVIMLSGLLLLYAQTGALAFADIFAPEMLRHLAETTVPGLGIPWATLIAMLIFGGAVGKSAQFPLHVWLPDAMEGPTPVSALIHAATMVSAGVYLVARTFPLFAAVEHGPQLGLVAFIGAFTALFASTIALAQNDIKRVLAYSTISQLGYMIASLGVGGYVAAVFHLITHAFFKALLFLGSGSVIHGMEHGHHAVAHQGHGEHAKRFDANDMMNMGGLKSKMPFTFWTFLVGTLALAGVVPFAGFWSKDEILAHAFEGFLHEGVASWPFFVWLLLTLAAFLTAFYMGRQVFLTFLGQPRTAAAEHAHESPRSMTGPLVALAVFASLLGLAGTPWGNLFHHTLARGYEVWAPEVLHNTPFSLPVAALSTALALGGLALGWWVYGRRPLQAGQPDPATRLGRVYTVLNRKYYVDELYDATVIRFTQWLSVTFARIDGKWVDGLVDAVGALTRWLSEALQRFVDTPLVDGAVNGVGRLVELCGRGLRLTQTGRVQNYLLVVLVTVLLLTSLYLYW